VNAEGTPDETRIVNVAVQKVRDIVDATRTPIDRCLAAKKLAPSLLVQVYAEKTAANLHRVANNITDKAIIARLRSSSFWTMERVIHLAAVAKDEVLDAMTAMMDEAALRAGAEERTRAQRPRFATRRDREVLEAMVDRIGKAEVRRVLSELAD
jgi:hypothetical protein